jgi:protocatechuate 3,4-dioxygenase beta subunit
VRVQLHRGLDRLRRLLPPSLALSVPALLGTRGLAAVKAVVLGRAELAAGAAAAGALSVLAGGLAVKKLVPFAACVACLVFAGTLWWFAGESAWPRAPSTPESVPHEVAALPAADPTATTAPSHQPLATLADPGTRPATGTLAVRVVWTPDSAPAAGVAVEAIPLDGTDEALARREATTDARGEARFGSLPAVDVELRPVHSGYVVRTVALAAGIETVATLEFDGTRRIEGLVVDAHAQPVAGAEIWATGVHRYFSAHYIATYADAAGRFRLRGASGVAAHAAGRGRSPFMWRAADADGVSRLTLVLVEGGAEISGSVTDAAGQPVPAARILMQVPGSGRKSSEQDGAHSMDWGSILVRLSDSAGRFSMCSLPAGKLLVTAEKPPLANAIQELVLTGDARREVTLVLGPGRAVAGIVRDASGKPVGGARVGVTRGRWQTARETRSGAGGRYRLEGIGPGRIEVSAGAPGFESNKLACEQAEGDLEWNPFLQPLPCIRGVVLDAARQPIPHASVRAESEPGRDIQVAPTDPNGRFSLPVPRGKTYLLTITEQGSAFGVRPKTLGRVPPDTEGLEILLADDERATAFVLATVLDATGKPARDASCWLRDEVLRWQYIHHRADPATGRVRLGPVPPRRYWLHIQPSMPVQPRSTHGPLDLAPCQELDLGVLRLRAGGTIAFRCVRSDGEPIESLSANLNSEDGEAIAVLDYVPGELRKSIVPAGTHKLDVFGNDFVSVIDRSVTVRENETTTVDLVVEPGRRRELRFPSPLPKDWGTVRRVAFEIGHADGKPVAGASDDDWELTPDRPQVRYFPSLAVGDYVLTLRTDDGRRYAGRFRIAGLEPGAPPIEVELR